MSTTITISHYQFLLKNKINILKSSLNFQLSLLPSEQDTYYINILNNKINHYTKTLEKTYNFSPNSAVQLQSSYLYNLY